MNKLSQWLVLIIFVHICFYANGQRIVFESDTILSWTNNKANALVNNDAFAQQLIDLIASDNSKSDIQYGFNYTLTLRLRQEADGRFSILAEMKDVNFTGDIQYRKIQTEHVLFPEFAGFTITVFAGNSSPKKPLFKKTIQDVSLIENMGYYSLCNEIFNDTTSHASLYCTIEHIRLSYGRKSLEQFATFRKSIEEYYAGGKALDGFLEQLIQMDVSNVQQVAFNLVVVNDIYRKINSLKEENFMQTLMLWKSDPVDFTGKIERISNLCDDIRFALTNKYNILDSLYYSRATHFLHVGKTDSAKFYLEKAITFSPGYSPAVSKLAEIENKAGRSEQALEILMKYVTNYALDAFHDKQLVDVSKDVMQSFIGQIDAELQKQEYVLAIASIEKAVSFCASVPQIGCAGKVFNLLVSAKYGMYRSYITVVQKAIENRKFEVAARYVDAAVAFQKENSSYILTADEAVSYTDSIFHACIKEIKRLNQKGDYVRSAELLPWLQAFCVSAQRATCIIPDYLEQQIASVFYTQRLTQIEAAVRKEQFIKAEELIKELTEKLQAFPAFTPDERLLNAQEQVQKFRFFEAMDLGKQSVNYGFTEAAFAWYVKAFQIAGLFPNAFFSDKFHEAKMFAISYLSQEMQKVATNHKGYSQGKLDERINYFNTLGTLFLITDSAKFAEQVNALRQISIKRFCDSVVSKFHTDYLSLQNSLVRGEYIAANKQLTSMYGHKEEWMKCGIDFSDLDKLSRSVLCYAILDSVYIEAAKHVATGDFKGAAGQFDIMFRFAQLNNLSEHIHKTFVEFLVSFKRSDFLLFGAERLVADRQYEEALQCMYFLKDFSTPKKETMTFQRKLGRLLAERDIVSGENKKKRDYVLKYSFGDSYFSYFSSSFSTTWLKIKFHIK